MPSNDLMNDIKTVLDISSRVDERVKMIQASQVELSSRMHQMAADLVSVGSRVTVLESKNGNRIHEVEDELNDVARRVDRMDHVGTEGSRSFTDSAGKLLAELKDQGRSLAARIQVLESGNDGWQSKFTFYWNLAIRGVWVVIVCYILFKLGLNTPPLP